MSDTVVDLHKVTKNFGDITAVENVDLKVERGELITLLGPSGCGKTTTLRLIAGFENPSEGGIDINGTTVSNVSSYNRDIGMVFQDFSLFPHMTVADNIAFGLKMNGFSEDEMNEKIEEVLEMVSLPNVGDRHPQNLSGGQKQRIALARSLVIEPEVLLLDEPLSNLDKKLREEMRLEVMRLHRELDVTMIYVTHNQSEALSMSDRMAVMDQGHIRQVGSPREVYQKPIDEYVADFIGTANLLRGEVTSVNDQYHLSMEAGFEIEADLNTPVGEKSFSVGSVVTVLLRPEALFLRHNTNKNKMSGDIQETTYLGSLVEYYIKLQDGKQVQVSKPAKQSMEQSPGDSVTVTFDTSSPILLGGD